MGATLYLRSFAAGELSPALASRADLPEYGAGLKRCRNFIVGRHGGAVNRPGTYFIDPCKTTSEDVRLVRYVHETPGASMLLELGVNYLRFYLNGERVQIDIADVADFDNLVIYDAGSFVKSGGVVYYAPEGVDAGHAPPDLAFWYPLPLVTGSATVFVYEIPTPFDFPREVKWAQSGRIITFVHQSTRPRDLRYIAPDNWILEDVTTVPNAEVPQNPSVAQPPAIVSVTYEVRGVSTINGAGPLSAAFTDDFGPPSVDRPITITWDDPIEGPPDYFEVFKGGYLLGTTSSHSFGDEGQAVGDPWSAGTGGDFVTAPQNLDATQGPATPILKSFRYVMTAVVAGEESFASDVAADSLEDPSPDRPHNIDCDDVNDATEYRFYADPNSNGTFGRIGTSPSSQFTYIGTPLPDYNTVPPTDGNFFGVADFPACVGYYQQRRFFGNTPSNPDTVKGSRVAIPNNFTVSSPLQDSDGISFRLIGAEQHAVRALVAVKDLFVMTDGGEWRSKTAPGEPLTPSNLPFDQEVYVGIHAQVRPVVVGNTVIYVQARGRKVVDLKFQQQVDGLAGRDLTLYASHLFDGFVLRALDYQYEPHSIVWAVRSDGALLGMTYLPELETFGWHRHDTKSGAGLFEDVCVVPEENQDAVYLLVARTVNGTERRYIELLANREEAEVFADSAITYEGAAVNTLDGLDHLEGETVAIVAGGAVRTSQLVAGGSVSLGANYTTAVAGLAIEAELETLDPDAPGSTMRSRKKRTGTVALLVDQSSRNFQVGPTADKLVRYAPRSTDQPDVASYSGIVELSAYARNDFSSCVLIRHDKPTPLTVLGILPDVEVGG